MVATVSGQNTGCTRLSILPGNLGKPFHFSALVYLFLREDNCKLINHLQKLPSFSSAQRRSHDRDGGLFFDSSE